MELIVGTILEGKVSGITNYGAFVAFPEGGSGLIHISEIANSYVTDVHDYLSLGQEVKVKVVSITPEGKANLSIKQTLPPEEKNSYRKNAKPSAPAKTAPSGFGVFEQGVSGSTSDDPGFEEKLKLFMKDSDSKMSGNKLYAERKSSNRRRK